MRSLFYIGVLGLLIFEFLKIYFIMPFPGSQNWDTVDLAYFLHQFRWGFRVAFLLVLGLGAKEAFSSTKKWLPAGCLLILVVCVLVFNFKMAADAMFKEPHNLSFLDKNSFTGSDSTLVIAIGNQREAKAYPVRYIIYHHQVRDMLGGDPVMVTYCSVCRTGRVFSPIINGKLENFRLVGMDHFNAMFEDTSTGSWWQQATGSAIVGELKGVKLDELESIQLTAGAFFQTYPSGKIMAPDPEFLSKYDSLGKYELGKSESALTGTSVVSWNDKSWVVGVSLGEAAKAYDWNQLKQSGSIRDRLGETEILILLSADSQSFVVYELPQPIQRYQWKENILLLDSIAYSFTGKSSNPAFRDLKRIQAYQEFWHSWRTFKPNSQVYLGN